MNYKSWLNGIDVDIDMVRIAERNMRSVYERDKIEHILDKFLKEEMLIK